MRSARPVLVLGNVALAALMAATLGSRLGVRAHHDAAYAALALAALAAWPILRRRRVATLLMASLGAWSALTGLLLVYVAPETSVGGRGMRWWHGVTSVGFLLAFVAHWARNHPRLVGLWRKLAQRRGLLVATVGAWALVAAVAVASWTTPLREMFTDRRFQLLASLALALAAAAVVYGGLAATSRPVRARLAETAARNRVRGAVDASLLSAMWLATLTGFPLLYLGRWLRGFDAYWPVAGWHVVTSAMLLGLVAFHVAFNRRPLRAHAR